MQLFKLILSLSLFAFVYAQTPVGSSGSGEGGSGGGNDQGALGASASGTTGMSTMATSGKSCPIRKACPQRLI